MNGGGWGCKEMDQYTARSEAEAETAMAMAHCSGKIKSGQPVMCFSDSQEKAKWQHKPWLVWTVIMVIVTVHLMTCCGKVSNVIISFGPHKNLT